MNFKALEKQFDEWLQHKHEEFLEKLKTHPGILHGTGSAKPPRMGIIKKHG